MRAVEIVRHNRVLVNFRELCNQCSTLCSPWPDMHVQLVSEISCFDATYRVETLMSPHTDAAWPCKKPLWRGYIVSPDRQVND